MNYLKYTPYVYLLAGLFFAYKAFEIWNQPNNNHFVFLGIAAVSVFMFFFRQKFAAKFEKRNQNTK